MLGKIAALLAALTATVHIFVGGQDALLPMLSANLPDVAEGAMHAVWHFTSVFLLWSVLVFWRNGKAVVEVALLWLIMATIFIYVGFDQDGLNGLVTNPQWTILGLTGGLALVAHLKNARQ